jgi:hypothetical protein
MNGESEYTGQSITWEYFTQGTLKGRMAVTVNSLREEFPPRPDGEYDHLAAARWMRSQVE